jgi:hypothetical protein
VTRAQIPVRRGALRSVLAVAHNRVVYRHARRGAVGLKCRPFHGTQLHSQAGPPVAAVEAEQAVCRCIHHQSCAPRPGTHAQPYSRRRAEQAQPVARGCWRRPQLQRDRGRAQNSGRTPARHARAIAAHERQTSQHAPLLHAGGLSHVKVVRWEGTKQEVAAPQEGVLWRRHLRRQLPAALLLRATIVVASTACDL